MKRGWIWGLVLVSLALNLFLGGLVAGRWLGGPQPGGFRAANPTDIVMPFNARQFLRSLPEERKKEIIKLIKGRTGEVRQGFRAVAETRKDVIAALEAEPFDQARLEAAFTGTRERFDDAVGAIHQVITVLATELTPEERKLMAQAIRDKARKQAERRAERRKKWKDKKRD